MKASEKEILQNLFKTSYDWLNSGDDGSYKLCAFEDDKEPLQKKTTFTEQISNELISSLADLYQEIRTCTQCPLCSYRTNAVPGMGVENPFVMVIGEGPGHDEDVQGLPFVGKAGQLLDKMLSAVGLDRQKNCYIANIVKCRPPQNRTPSPDESQTCIKYLHKQINFLKPKAILLLGRTAVQNLLDTAEGINSLRGKMFKFQNIPLIATYHPSALLRDETLKRPAWEDLKYFKELLLKINPNYQNYF